ncbi:MAG: bacillolysin, partial [Actinomycetota bacterium]|nr:bacillolysin [Actinomycetota bacterium]
PFLDLTYAKSGTTNMFGIDSSVTSDMTISRTANVAVPTGVSTYLRFNHAFDLESTYDGGRVEYSTDNGSTYNDAASLFVDNGYTGNAAAFAGNAFTGTSRGYTSSRVNLTSLAGLNVRFRFRIKTDSTVGVWGWWIDDVRVYRCNASAAPIPDAGADKQVNSGAAFTLDGSGSSSPSGSTPLTYLWVQLSGTQAVINNDRAATTTVNGVPGAATLTFQLTVKDANGQTKTDTVVINVKAPK